MGGLAQFNFGRESLEKVFWKYGTGVIWVGNAEHWPAEPWHPPSDTFFVKKIFNIDFLRFN